MVYLFLSAWSQASAHPDPHVLLNQAIAADLATTGVAGTARALALYRIAADAGLPEAQLNVAVMYDSGRGTVRDAGQAADYYAAAATGGVARAAFDLGQLYEAGDGVPQNPELARAWFSQAAAEGLAAAAGRHLRAMAAPAALLPPVTRYPREAASVSAPEAGLALVWTAPPAPGPASYFVQVMLLDGIAPTLSFSTTTDVSATRMPAPRPGRYAWRVFVICPSLGRYVPSGWAGFSVT